MMCIKDRQLYVYISFMYIYLICIYIYTFSLFFKNKKTQIANAKNEKRKNWKKMKLLYSPLHATTKHSSTSRMDILENAEDVISGTAFITVCP